MDPMVIFGMIMALVIAAIMICSLDSDTKSIRRAGYNESSVGREYIMKPNGTDKRYEYVYATCNSEKWPCGAVLVVEKNVKSYELNKDYVFVFHDTSATAPNQYPCGIYRYSEQSWGNGFKSNINHGTCIGKVVGIRIGNINQLF